MDNFFNILLPDDCESVLCAVSGGADSVFLLHVLKKLGDARGIKVCAAHFEHGIRGGESLRDASFTEELCRSLGVECITEHGNVPEFAEKNHLGTEEAARVLRYAFLNCAAEKLSCRYIATAHNADDNAETMLFDLIRGSGGRGLCGIPPVRGNIIRPILHIPRSEIEAYLRKNSITYVEDSTNLSDEYSRNLIRHRVMPVLRELNPAFSSAAFRTAELLRQDEDYLSALAADFVKKNFDGESIPSKALSALHPAIASRVVRQILGENAAYVHVCAVLALAHTTERSFADIPGKRICAEQGRIYFSEPKAVRIPEIELVPGETVEIPDCGIKIKTSIGDFSRDVHDSLNTFQLKYENICSVMHCSGRKSGDSFSPAGRGCTKTLKKLFLERRMPQSERDRTVVIRDGDKIAAVSGFGIDSFYQCSPGDTAMKIEIINTKHTESNDRRF